MTSLGLSVLEVITLLSMGAGPIRLSLVFLATTGNLDDKDRRRLALRTVLVGGAIALAVLVLGGAVVRNFAPRVEYMAIGVGLVLLVTALASFLRTAVPATTPVTKEGLASFAITPLAVPGMIGPVGFALLFAEAAYPDGLGEFGVFLLILLGMLALDYGTLRLALRVVRSVSIPVLVVLQYVLNLLTAALGVRLVLGGLAGLGVLTIR